MTVLRSIYSRRAIAGSTDSLGCLAFFGLAVLFGCYCLFIEPLPPSPGPKKWAETRYVVVLAIDPDDKLDYACKGNTIVSMNDALKARYPNAAVLDGTYKGRHCNGLAISFHSDKASAERVRREAPPIFMGTSAWWDFLREKPSAVWTQSVPHETAPPPPPPDNRLEHFLFRWYIIAGGCLAVLGGALGLTGRIGAIGQDVGCAGLVLVPGYVLAAGLGKTVHDAWANDAALRDAKRIADSEQRRGDRRVASKPLGGE